MQFFPIPSAQDAQSLFAASGNDSQTKSRSELFSELLGQYLPQPQAAAGADVQAQGASALVQGAAASQAGTAAALKMTEDDFAKVKDSLAQFGLSEKDVSDLGAAVKSPEGLTWERFAEKVTEKIERLEQGIELTPIQQQHVYSFLQKLGFAPEKMEQLADDIAAGRHTSALAEITSAAAKMGADGKVSLGQQELATLMGLLRISETTQSRVQQLLAAKGGELGRQDMATTLNLLKEDMLKRQAAKKEGLTKLRDAIDTAWSDARAEARRQSRADRRQDSTPQEMLLKAERAQDEREKAKAELAWAARRQEPADKKEERTEKDGKDGKDGKVAPVRAEEGVAKSRPTKSAAVEAALAGRVEESQSSAEKQTGAGKEDASGWSDFLRKVKTEAEVAPRKTTAAGFENAVTAGLAQVQPPVIPAAGLTENIASRQVLAQVRTALLNSTPGGAQSLSLELTPDNLGKLNVMLQVNNKEVQAVIKADTPEAHRVLTEQAALIKDALEQQGFKVAKLEIQTSLSKNDYSGGFAGMEEFSQGRNEAEQSVFKSALNRLRGTGRALAQGLHDNVQAATSSRPGLDLIA